jgi:argininosuccinate lyase
VRGRTSRLLGLYVMAASLNKGLPSGYNKDTQESKYALMHGVETALGIFTILAKALPLLKVDEEEAKLELEKGYACTTELADLLAKKGVPFRTAHETTGKLVRECIAKKKLLSALSAGEVSSAAGVKIGGAELKEAVSVDKTARFSAKYKIPAVSAHANGLDSRMKALEAAHALLAKEVALLSK